MPNPEDRAKDLAYYRRLPYTRTVEIREEPRGSAVFLAQIAEIPFIRIHGSSREEALVRLAETFEDCISALLEAGEEIPEPTRWPGPGGEMVPQLSLLPGTTSPVVRPARSLSAAGDVVPWTKAQPPETVGV
jgi:predicted RNase H-like HicB family nuclease